MPALLVLGAVFGLTACDVAGAQVKGTGKVTTDHRKVGAFSSVHVSGSMDAEVTIARTTSVEVIGDDNVVPLIRTEVRGGQLVVDSRDSYSTRSPLVVRITTPTLAAFSSSGSGDAAVRGVTGDRLDLQVSGSGSIDVAGRTKQLTAEVSGSGEIHARRLAATTARAIVSGSGEVELTVSDTLDAVVSGSGSIDYWGNPTVKRTVSGSGSIAGALTRATATTRGQVTRIMFSWRQRMLPSGSWNHAHRCPSISAMCPSVCSPGRS